MRADGRPVGKNSRDKRSDMLIAAHSIQGSRFESWPISRSVTVLCGWATDQCGARRHNGTDAKAAPSPFDPVAFSSAVYWLDTNIVSELRKPRPNPKMAASMRSGAEITACPETIFGRDDAIVRIHPKRFALPLQARITMHENLRNSSRSRPPSTHRRRMSA
jgi:hypothetical protein